MKELESIKDDLKKNQLKPFYVLDGEEPYYIDLLTDYLEEHVLQPSERDFNQTVFYGKDRLRRISAGRCLLRAILRQQASGSAATLLAP